MLRAVAASALSLVPIGADDARLGKKRTFVSEQARIELSLADGEHVLCHDRKRAGSICLTQGEWTKAIALAEQQPRKGRGDVIPLYRYAFPDTVRFGLDSSPSTFTHP